MEGEGSSRALVCDYYEHSWDGALTRRMTGENAVASESTTEEMYLRPASRACGKNGGWQSDGHMPVAV